jgi:zinc transporter ZupT
MLDALQGVLMIHTWVFRPFHRIPSIEWFICVCIVVVNYFYGMLTGALSCATSDLDISTTLSILSHASAFGVNH